jgi:hypothetical protein
MAPEILADIPGRQMHQSGQRSAIFDIQSRIRICSVSKGADSRLLVVGYLAAFQRCLGRRGCLTCFWVEKRKEPGTMYDHFHR